MLVIVSLLEQDEKGDLASYQLAQDMPVLFWTSPLH